MKPAVELQIQPISPDESEVIGQFLHDYFFPEEPLNSTLKRLPQPNEVPFIGVLKEGLSFKAVNVLENNIVGVCVNTEVSFAKRKNLNSITDPKQYKIYKLLIELDQRAKIWEIVNNENHFNILSVSVNNKYRGHGIGQKLVEESLKLAKSLNFKYASIECSSFYSAKFALAMGFELLAEIPYKEYLDENNEQVFKVREPHTALKKLIKRLC